MNNYTEGFDAGVDFADFQAHQLSQERQQIAEQAAARLATGMGGRQEIEILCREAGIDSPYK